MSTAHLLLLLSAAVGAAETEKKIDKAFAPYIEASPLTSSTPGVYVYRRLEGGTVIVVVASATMKTRADRQKAQTTCRALAIKELVAARKGVRVYEEVRLRSEDRALVEDKRSSFKNVQVVLSVTVTRVEGIGKALTPVGSWRNSDTLYMAYGVKLDKDNRPEPARGLVKKEAKQIANEKAVAREALLRLAKDPAVIRDYAPFTSLGRSIIGRSPPRKSLQQRPASWRNLQRSRATKSVERFAQAGAGTLTGFKHNDRPPWAMPRTQAQWRQAEKRLALFLKLAPIWVELGTLDP